MLKTSDEASGFFLLSADAKQCHRKTQAIIEMKDAIAADVTKENRRYIFENFTEHNVFLRPGAKVGQFYTDGVDYTLMGKVRHKPYFSTKLSGPLHFRSGPLLRPHDIVYRKNFRSMVSRAGRQTARKIRAPPMSTSTTSGYQDQPMNFSIRKVSVIKYSIRGMKTPSSARAPP